MDRRPLRPEEAAVRRYVEELWLPYHRDLESTAARHALADDVDLVAEEVEFRLDRLGDDAYRAWVLVDAPEDEPADAGIADTKGDLVGFVTTEVVESPSVFDTPKRLTVGDIYVREDHRGTGLADRLIDTAVERARETGCTELRLDVDVDNERAMGFYERLGFEVYRYSMAAPVDEL